LESSINGLKPLKSVEQLHTCFTHLVSSRGKLLGMLDGEANPIHRDSRLIRHFEFGRRGT
jgi:hypothetical protein